MQLPKELEEDLAIASNAHPNLDHNNAELLADDYGYTKETILKLIKSFRTYKNQ